MIINGSNDNRNFVKKAVNWALRSIGKKNKFLNKRALEVSNEILAIDCKSCING
ncbi:DNA alkylation repair protein [uncultured Methanobrevibacter sp.]|uniref:DNA alkylation repair protein n=1 Tax=uncultured Methanobrevibacter sp. TaxID=253161 RepID=UPI0025F45C7F|nr:DNA alkylation repair protein [uncultured Methanobrevibacter sp.]